MVLTDSIQEQILALASNNASEHTAVDVYRVIREQAELLYQTECLRENLATDPFQALSRFDRSALGKRLQVTAYDCVRTRQDYVKIQAQVEIQDNLKNGNNKGSFQLPKLFFAFEREPTEEGGTILTYTIDFSFDPLRAKDKLLWVQVAADGNHPSKNPARDMADAAADDDEDEADWSDVDSVDEDNTGNDVSIDNERKTNNDPSRKRAKTTYEDGVDESGPNNNDAADKSTTNQHDDACDRFMAGMDPDILSEFVKVTACSMDEATAFFLLMSFPFYEMEWDLVGFVLESVFGSESDSDSE